MVEIDKNNTGFATKNKYYESEKHPKFKGVVKVNDEQMQVAVWVKTSLKTGDTFLSFQFQTEEEAKKYIKKNEKVEIPEDDLPF